MREVTIDAIGSTDQLLDVREPDEFASGHLPGAVNIAMGALARRLDELDRARPVFVVCATGGRSAAMVDLLAAAGFDARNVGGGTRAWTEAGRPLVREHPALTVRVIETPSLGDRTYLVHDGRFAFVVDPQRDVDRLLSVIEEEDVELTHVFETHIHNDYVTGGLALAEITGADYHVNADDPVRFVRVATRDGDVVPVGPRMRVRAIATPGHTFTHLSYAVTDGERSFAVFTGGSLLYGATGRPDLLGSEHTDTLVRHQHASARRLAESLPETTEVFPTHGFGSFCSATQSDSTSSTIGAELSANPVLTQDEETYVRELLAGLSEWPAYYAHMGPANLDGPLAPDLSPVRTADAAELRARIEAGEWVVDLRDRTAFASGYAPGTLNFGIDGPFATYLGWLIAWGTPLSLLGETEEQVAEAQRELVRIGIDRPAARATGAPEDWSDRDLARFPTATFADLAHVRHHREVVVLDVRRRDEYASGAIEGAVNIPLHEITHRLDEVPPGEVWVHCAGGYRASVAASFVASTGRHLVAVDDSFDAAASAGLPLITPIP